MLSIVINILLVIHVIVSFLIIFVVLMQRPKSEGLGAAFGGGTTENLFGADTTNVLATVTRWLGGIFFALALTLSILYAQQGAARNAIPQELLNVPKPPAAPLATASPAVSGSAAMQQMLQKAINQAAAAKSSTSTSITGTNATIQLAPATPPSAATGPLSVAPLDATPAASPAASAAVSPSSTTVATPAATVAPTIVPKATASPNATASPASTAKKSAKKAQQ